MRRLGERGKAVRRCQSFDDGHDAWRLELDAACRERRLRGGGRNAAVDARAVVLMLAGRMRVTGGVVMRVMSGRMVSHSAEARVRQLSRGARVHRTDAHDRRFADTEDEPDGEKCAQHASRDVPEHWRKVTVRYG